ncbi:hypothetical protein [Pseudomonas sp. RIT-PI-S]|uniref:hypothetical protein n=1 Tax=Pseudomonas sp. RIT-PI-S TaxID=3035295 RepID=UPI0021D9FB72|nr:hypothetical protein [Pseudomonas sp. RIT-PI-S]
MINLHEQALAGIHRQVLQRLVNMHAHTERQAMIHLAERVSRRYPRPSQARLVLLCSGERDGLLAMAMLRGAQLLLAAAQGSTFNLRVAVPMLPGLSSTDHANLRRGIAALFLMGDARVEVLAVTHQGLAPYEGTTLTGAEPASGTGLLPTTQCGSRSPDACLLAAAHLAWRAMEDIASESQWVMAQAPAALLRSFALARRLLRRAYGPGAETNAPSVTWLPLLAALHERSCDSATPAPRMAPPLALHTLLPRSPKRRWALAMNGLGMQIDPFSLRHDPLACEDPLLGAHLAGVKARYLEDDDYAAGLAGYLRPCFERLRREGVPVRRLAALRSLWLGEQAGQAYRLQRHVEQRYGWSEQQLRDLLLAPLDRRG